MKKILSIVISAVMLFSALSICVVAAPTTTYTGSVDIPVDATYTFDPEDYNITLELKDTQSGAFDGESDNFTYTLDSIRAGAVYYDESNPEEFFNVFTAVFVEVPRGCCLTVAVENTSADAINVQNANLIVERVA
jgi:hypothetical protein